MKALKNLIGGLLVGMLIGLWFGVNVGKGRPLVSNPFAEPAVQQSLRSAGEQVLERGGEALEHGGRTLREKLKE